MWVTCCIEFCVKKLSARWLPRWLPQTASATVRAYPSSVWRCLNVARSSFSTPETKEESKQCISTDEEGEIVLSARKVITSFSVIPKVWSTSTPWRRAKWSQGFTMLNYCADSKSNCRKSDPVFRRRWKHQLTLPPSPRPNWSNEAANCRPIHGILQIWSGATYFCFQNWRWNNEYVVRKLFPKMIKYFKTPVLYNLNHSFTYHAYISILNFLKHPYINNLNE